MATQNREAQEAEATLLGGVFGQAGSGINEAAAEWGKVLGAEDGDEEHETDDDAQTTKDGKGKNGRGKVVEEDDDEGEDADDDAEDDEEDGEDEDGEDEDGDDDDDDDDDDEGSDSVDPNAKVKVKVDGEEMEVTVAELQEGYSRTQDYTRKTQAVAQERQQVEQELQQVTQQKQQWGQLLEQAQVNLQAQLSGRTPEQWAQLKAQDEYAYIQERDREYAVRDKMDHIQTENQRLQQEFQQQQQQERQKIAKAEQEQLQSKLPDWANAEVATKEYKQILDYGQELGYSPDEIKGILDHRAILVLRDAALYRNMKNAADKGREKVTKKPATKSLKSGTASNTSPKKAKARKAAQRHSQKKSIGSLTDYFESSVLTDD